MFVIEFEYLCDKQHIFFSFQFSLYYYQLFVMG